jgi:glycosyltransferase involved in cell wall biosynthesis
VKRPFRYTVEKNKSQRSLFGGVSEVLHVICPSEWIQSQVTKLNNSSDIKTYVVRNPISKKLAADDFKKPTTISNEKYKITFVAQNLFNRYKGLDTLLRCISDYSLEFKSQNISFVFVGAGPRIDIGELKAQQIDLLKEDQIQKVLNGSDLLIVPSLSDNSPNVIFEALACGVPFVCSDRAGLLELGFEFGMNVFKYGESRSIFEAIIRQKNSAVNPQELREKALSIVSPQIVAKTMIGIYNEILASS